MKFAWPVASWDAKAVHCRGLLIRGGDILEAASHVDTIVFDKTGTLTEGRPRVRWVVPASSHMAEDRLLTLAAALERESSHPLAAAVLAAAEQRGELVQTPPSTSK